MGTGECKQELSLELKMEIYKLTAVRELVGNYEEGDPAVLEGLNGILGDIIDKLNDIQKILLEGEANE